MKREPKRAARPQPVKPAPAPAENFPPYVPWVLLALVVVLTAAVRIRLLTMPLERDEGEYAYAGQLMLQGIPPYQAVFNMKFPGVYAAYAVIMSIFGQTAGGIHFGFLLLNAGTIVLVFLLGRRLFSAASGVAAAAAYALLSLGAGVYGAEAHATHFVVAAALAATLLLLRAVETESSALILASGLLYGLALLMKQHGIFFGLFGGLYLLRKCFKEFRMLGLYCVGFVAPLAATGLILWHAGVFGTFWFWTIDYAREYASENTLTGLGIPYFIEAFPLVVGANVLIWIFAGAGLTALWWLHYNRGSTAFVTVFLLFSFAAVCPGWWFRGHYFVLMLPAVALLAGSLVSAANRISWGVFAAVLIVSMVAQRDYLFRWSPAEALRQIYGYCPFGEAEKIGEYIRNHSDKGARIAVLGSEPEIYFYAHRLSATGYIYTYSMMEAQPFAVTMQNEMIHQIEAARPEYIVFVNMGTSWLRHPDSPVKIDEWWNTYCPREYKLMGAADIISPERTDYYWENLAGYHPLAQLITVFRRRDLPAPR